MKREIFLDNGINIPKNKLKMLKTDLIFHTAKPTFITKVDSFLDSNIPPRFNQIDEKREIKYLTKYLKEHHFGKTIIEKPPLYLFTSVLAKGFKPNPYRSTTYQSFNKSINRSQVSFYYLNQKNKKVFSPKTEKKTIKKKLFIKERLHKAGFIPKKTYNSEEKDKVKNVISKEIPIEKYLKEDFKPIMNKIIHAYSKSKTELNKEIKLLFNIPENIIPVNELSEKNRLRSKYIKLFPKEKKDYTPKKALFNLKRIKLDYGIDDESMKKFKPINKKKFIKKEIPKKEKIHKWKKAIITSSIQLRKLNIENLPIEYYELNSHPYLDSDSKEYFESLKSNDLDTFINLTFKNKLLLLNHDYSHETVLHIMAKRNIFLFISFAIRNGGNPNSKNYIGRTPLHLACENFHKESILVLLYEMADPFVKDIYGKTPFDIWNKENENANEYIFRTQTIKRYLILDSIHRFSLKKYSEYMKIGLKHLWNYDLHLNFNPSRFGIFEK